MALKEKQMIAFVQICACRYLFKFFTTPQIFSFDLIDFCKCVPPLCVQISFITIAFSISVFWAWMHQELRVWITQHGDDGTQCRIEDMVLL